MYSCLNFYYFPLLLFPLSLWRNKDDAQFSTLTGKKYSAWIANGAQGLLPSSILKPLTATLLPYYYTHLFHMCAGFPFSSPKWQSKKSKQCYANIRDEGAKYNDIIPKSIV